MTHSQLDAMLAESGLAPGEATELTDLLAPLAAPSGEAPTPSAELIRIFGGEATRTSSPQRPPVRRRRSRGTFAGVVVLAVSGVGATGLSAAANTLPSAWQHQVAAFSHHYLPFDFPEPPTQKPRHSLRAPAAGGTQPSESTARGTRLDASNDANPSATRSPYPNAVPRAGDGPGEVSEQQHEVRGSSQTPVARRDADEDRSRNNDRENRDKVRGSDKSNDSADENRNKSEYDSANDRGARGGGSGPTNPGRASPPGVLTTRSGPVRTGPATSTTSSTARPPATRATTR